MPGDESAKDAESAIMCRLSKNELIQQNVLRQYSLLSQQKALVMT